MTTTDGTNMTYGYDCYYKAPAGAVADGALYRGVSAIVGAATALYIASWDIKSLNIINYFLVIWYLYL